MAIQYYAGNRLTGVSGDSKPTTLPTGSTFLETNTDDLYLWDGDSWNVVASNTGTETLSNKTFSDSLVFDEISAPGNAATNKVRLYAKDGGKIYSKDDSGNEFDLTAGVGSTGSMSGASDTTFTSPNDAALIIYDTGTSMWRDADMSGVATITDTGVMALASAAITGQTAEATVNNTNDFVLIYDASASALRKMSVSNLVAGGVSVDTLSALDDTTIDSIASAQVLIYDGSDSWDNKTVSGDATISTSGVLAIVSDVIINADVKSDAAIAYSKLAALTSGNILVGNGSNVATSVNPSGDIDVTNAGVFSIASDSIINADVKSDAAIAYSKLAALSDGNILVGNGSNVATSVNPSGDIDVTNAGVFSIAAGVIVNADVNASAAIVDTKLATISTADKVAGGAIQIDSGTDGTGIEIAATDKFLVDDGGATKYVNASQLKTYTSGDSADKAFAIAMAVAL